MIQPSIGSKLGLDGSKLVQTGLRIVGNVIPRSMAEGVTVTDGSFDGVPVSIYRPSAEQQTGRGVLFLHGGGWVIGEQGKSVVFQYLWCKMFSRLNVNMLVISEASKFLVSYFYWTDSLTSLIKYSLAIKCFTATSQCHLSFLTMAA